jgi:PleD family two-component response regulator
MLFLGKGEHEVPWLLGELREGESFVPLNRGRGIVREVVKGQDPDLLFLLLDLSRRDFLARIGEIERYRGRTRPPIVIIPEKASPRSLAAALHSGADDYIDLEVGLGKVCHVARRVLKRKMFLAELESVRHALEEQKTHDELTGLLRRSAIRVRLEEEFARAQRYQHPLSLALIDIDYFNAINEAHGQITSTPSTKRTARKRETESSGRSAM